MTTTQTTQLDKMSKDFSRKMRQMRREHLKGSVQIVKSESFTTTITTPGFEKIERELQKFFAKMLRDLSHMDLPKVHHQPTWMDAPETDIPLLPENPVINPLQLRALTSEIAPRIVELLGKLQKIAWKFEFHGLDAEDTLQTICINLMEKELVEPEFYQQSEAYICQYAKWTASHLLHSTEKYQEYVDSEEWTTDDQGDEVSSFEYIPTTDPDTEEMFIRHESEVKLAKLINTMEPENRKVVKMLYIGYSRSEIAKTLNISRPAVSQRIKTIQKTLRPICKQYGLAQYATI